MAYSEAQIAVHKQALSSIATLLSIASSTTTNEPTLISGSLVYLAETTLTELKSPSTPNQLHSELLKVIGALSLANFELFRYDLSYFIAVLQNSDISR